MREPCVDQPMIAPARHPRIDEPIETRRQIFDHTARLPSPRTGNGWHHPQSAAGPTLMREPCHAGDLGPGLKGLGAGSSILADGDAVAAEMKEVVDLIVGGEETLCLPRRLEVPHLPLSPSRRLVRVPVRSC